MNKPQRKLLKKDTYDWYVNWYILPYEEKKEMGIVTESKFARVYDISQKQLCIWKKRPSFYEDVDTALRGRVAFDKVNLYRSIFNKAKKSPKYAKLWLELFSNIKI